MRWWVRSLASLSGLRFHCCCGCDLGWQLQLQSDPQAGNLHMQRVWPLKANNNNNNKPKKQKNNNKKPKDISFLIFKFNVSSVEATQGWGLGGGCVQALWCLSRQLLYWHESISVLQEPQLSYWCMLRNISTCGCTVFILQFAVKEIKAFSDQASCLRSQLPSDVAGVEPGTLVLGPVLLLSV